MKTVTVDPVCGMDVDESSELRAEHEGTTYLFCSETCRQRFLRDPEEFTEGRTRDEQSGEERISSSRCGGRRLRRQPSRFHSPASGFQKRSSCMPRKN